MFHNVEHVHIYDKTVRILGPLYSIGSINICLILICTIQETVVEIFLVQLINFLDVKFA